MSEILLLGPGKSRERLLGPNFSGDRDNLWVIERSEAHRRSWDDARYFVRDLRDAANIIEMPQSHFDEIHAYEVLNLLNGDAIDFFEFWRWMWDILKPAGQVIASTPYWQSRFIHAYPGQQRVYTPELLAYLDYDYADSHAEDFSDLWPKPYRFKSIFMASSEDGAAFYFRLAKC